MGVHNHSRKTPPPSLPPFLPSSPGELVIIDVNYFPSYKGIPEAPAALQAALRERYAVAAVATGGDR